MTATPVLKVNNINGVGTKALFHDFPYFTTTKMLPQCSSHDLLGTIHKWNKLMRRGYELGQKNKK